jgi:hypothetical protein
VQLRSGRDAENANWTSVNVQSQNYMSLAREKKRR